LQREELVEAWQKQMPAEQRERALEVLLGNGGHYGETLLSLRAEMFHNLESAVHGEARDLELLNRYLVRSLTSPLPGESLSPPKL
jgi:hypothetical protein